jgi:hypothetical protein
MAFASATAQIGFSRAVINGNLARCRQAWRTPVSQLAVARPAYFSLSRKRHACVGSGMVPGIMVMPQNGLFPLRDQPLLLRVDIREWLPEDHLAFVVLDAVATLDLGEFRRRTLVPAPLRPGQARRRCRREPGRPVRGSRHHAGAAAHRRRDHRRPALARGGPRRMPGPGRCATRCQVPRDAISAAGCPERLDNWQARSLLMDPGKRAPLAQIFRVGLHIITMAPSPGWHACRVHW